MSFILVNLIGILLIVVQQCIKPPPGWFLIDFPFIPLLAIYAALFLSPASAWFTALSIGTLTDLVSENRLGATVLCLLFTVLLVQSQKPEHRTRWFMQMFLTLVGTMAFLCLDRIFYWMQRPVPLLTANLAFQMTCGAIFNALLAVPAFALMERWRTLFFPPPAQIHDPAPVPFRTYDS